MENIEIIDAEEKRKKELDEIRAIEDSSERAKKIRGLSDDRDKIELSETIWGEADRSSIIITLKDDKDKIELIKTFVTERGKANIIASLSNDEDKKELLQEIND